MPSVQRVNIFEGRGRDIDSKVDGRMKEESQE